MSVKASTIAMSNDTHRRSTSHYGEFGRLGSGASSRARPAPPPPVPRGLSSERMRHSSDPRASHKLRAQTPVHTPARSIRSGLGLAAMSSNSLLSLQHVQEAMHNRRRLHIDTASPGFTGSPGTRYGGSMRGGASIMSRRSRRLAGIKRSESKHQKMKQDVLHMLKEAAVRHPRPVTSRALLASRAAVG